MRCALHTLEVVPPWSEAQQGHNTRRRNGRPGPGTIVRLEPNGRGVRMITLESGTFLETPGMEH